MVVNGVPRLSRESASDEALMVEAFGRHRRNRRPPSDVMRSRAGAASSLPRRAIFRDRPSSADGSAPNGCSGRHADRPSRTRTRDGRPHGPVAAGSTTAAARGRQRGAARTIVFSNGAAVSSARVAGGVNVCPTGGYRREVAADGGWPARPRSPPRSGSATDTQAALRHFDRLALPPPPSRNDRPRTPSRRGCRPPLRDEPPVCRPLSSLAVGIAVIVTWIDST